MTRRQFWLGALFLCVFAAVVGPMWWISYQKAEVERSRAEALSAEETRRTVVEKQTELEVERERTKRSENRWKSFNDMVEKVPFMGDK